MSRVIVITGTRKGLGNGLAHYYLNQGDTVIGCSRGECDIIHLNYFHYCLDVSDEIAVSKMIKSVFKRHKKIDCLLNNAGIASMNHILLTPLKTMESIFQTNFFGSFLFLREVSKVMLKANYGRIVNFSTVATPLRLEGEAAYAASKAAIVSLTEICARELAEFGITVNAVGPTPVPTDLIKNVPKQKMDQLLQRQAIKRFGTLDDIIQVVDFFIDRKSQFVTGQILYLGGVHS